jgi:hypothetical protein
MNLIEEIKDFFLNTSILTVKINKLVDFNTDDFE